MIRYKLKQVLISSKRNFGNELLNQLPNELRFSILGAFKIYKNTKIVEICNLNHSPFSKNKTLARASKNDGNGNT